MDESRARNVEAHHLHHHLVGIGGAVKGAGAGRVIAAHLACQQFLASDLAFGIELAGTLLFLIGDTGAHGAGGHEDRRQMPEAQRAHQQAGHDLVANAQKRDTVIHGMAQRDGGRKRDRVTAEKRKLHARFALCDTVAHCRCPAGYLYGRPDLARPDLHQLGITVIGLMGREHVVIGRHHTKVRPLGGHDCGLVLLGSGKGMGQIRAGKRPAIYLSAAFAVHQVEIIRAALPRVFDHPPGHPMDRVVQRFIRHASSPRRVRPEQSQRSAPSCLHHRIWA